ncbi:NADH-quinone oxidoreductase subunit J [Desertibacillus haloalkaliphilus]|uniref:NADH-quinone oxidoreductase subunit J n=1 Tax=Desertibacillus haloalkaliphilus TaxID=1328930 RepID=UPI001C261740|nr:NADH-quinone oxidoreductase subunit J [Desertibacillus haloalkaliphilus]MBU8905898.1 NADH-quinone oxidoreductase subunit J [Desertibacillus haloalkaliphilus]
MNGEFLAFFVFALIAISGGVLMINLRKVVHIIFVLMFTFLSIAGLYVLLSAEFIAFVQVLIYSGAITIMMLFGIMLTKHDDKAMMSVGFWRSLAALVGIVAFFVIIFIGINDLSLGEQATTLHENNVEQIGIAIFSKFVIPFETVGVILLVVLVGAIALAKKDEPDEEASKYE